MSISHCHPLINIWIIARFVLIMIKAATFLFYGYIYSFLIGKYLDIALAESDVCLTL